MPQPAAQGWGYFALPLTIKKDATIHSYLEDEQEHWLVSCNHATFIEGIDFPGCSGSENETIPKKTSIVVAYIQTCQET